MSKLSILDFPKFKTVQVAYESKYINDAIKLCDGNVRKAVRLTGIPVCRFYRMMKKYKLHTYAEAMQ